MTILLNARQAHSSPSEATFVLCEKGDLCTLLKQISRTSTHRPLPLLLLNAIGECKDDPPCITLSNICQISRAHSPCADGPMGIGQEISRSPTRQCHPWLEVSE